VPSFLFKTEPTGYSYADLVRDKRAVWDGVSNALALIHLRKVAKGDTVVIYHTGDEKAAVGLATALSGAYPDPKLGDPKRVVVDLEPARMLKHPVPLATFKTDPVLRTVDLVRISRLSVMPLTAAQLERVLEHAASGPAAPTRRPPPSQGRARRGGR
jgi:predicted RNA-binding protein with PUA-like domain